MKQNVHIMSTAGIAGNITEGAYSIVLSSGYTDNVDNGEVMYVPSHCLLRSYQWHARLAHTRGLVGTALPDIRVVHSRCTFCEK